MELVAPIELYLITSFVFGLAVTIPAIILFSYLFVIGLEFGYRVLTPYLIWAMFPFFSAVGSELVVSIMDFYNVLFLTTLVTGLIFTFPVFLVLLVKYGIVGTNLLARNRRYLYVGSQKGQTANFVEPHFNRYDILSQMWKTKK